MMFSYPYFNSPYYHRYSRYGYYYPNAYYASTANSVHTGKETANKNQSNNNANVNGVEQSKIQKRHNSNTRIIGHNGVTPYKYSHKRCPYKQFFLCTKKGRTFF